MAQFQENEAGAGIEPANSGFADRDLTTWLPRQIEQTQSIRSALPVSIKGNIEHWPLRACRAVALRRRVGRWTFALEHDLPLVGLISRCPKTHPRRGQFTRARTTSRGR